MHFLKKSVTILAFSSTFPIHWIICSVIAPWSFICIIMFLIIMFVIIIIIIIIIIVVATWLGITGSD